MFLDFDEMPAASELRADLCLVGAGLVGLALTDHLLRHTSADILLIEQGGLIDREELTSVPAERNSGDVASGLAASRAMGFGGSTLRWGGQALPFSRTDLGPRNFLELPGGWPISREELERHYATAERFLKLSAVPFDTDLWRNETLAQWFGPSRPLDVNFSKWSPIAYLARQYRGRIGTSRRVTCLLNARAVEVLLADDHHSATGLRLRNRHGREATAHGRIHVLCGGGIDNPRLLLASRQGDRRGIGHEHDVVGRYYQDHAGYYGARLTPRNRRLFGHLFATFLVSPLLPGRQKFVPKLQLSEQQQRTQQLLNVTGNLAVEESEQSARMAARRLYRSLVRSRGEKASLRDAGALLKAPGDALSIGAHFLRGRIRLPDEATFWLMANAESEPLRDSRIVLSDEPDAYGMARPIIHWLLGDRTFRSLQAYYEGTKQALEGAGIATVTLSHFLTEPGADWKANAYSLYHHMGATRMAHSPREGVVNTDSRVHGVANLYVAGTSVLPTGSASNPSFTALALTLRLAEHLQARL
jgi:choline dehydrogenase-like flavoprotein